MTKTQVTQHAHSRAGTSMTVRATLTVTHTMFTTNQAISDARASSRHRQLLRWGHYAHSTGETRHSERSQRAAGLTRGRRAAVCLDAPALEDETSSVLEAVTAVPTLPGAPSRRGPTARRPRFRKTVAGEERSPRRPPQAGAAHLKAWPPRWACARRRAWLGSFRPLPRAAPRC